jgi:predicted permease
VKEFLLRLVGCLPARFRDDFGAGVGEQIEVDYERARSRGWGAAVAFTVVTAGDLLLVAALERVRPGRPGAWGMDTEKRRGDGMMRTWWRDLAFAWRSLRRSPSFMLTAVGTIGVALGITSAIFAVVQKVLIEPLPYEDADRLVYIAASAPGFDFPDEFGVSLEFYFEYRELTDVLEDVGTFNSFTNTLRIGDRVERVRMSIPTPSMFTTLGVQPMIGRLPVAEDEQDVMLISHAAWQDWFGADPSVIGRGFEVAGGTRTVIGVMGPDFAFPNEGVLVWIPNNVRNEGLNPGRFGVSLVGRVPEGVELEAVRARLRDASRVFPEKYGGSARYLRLMELHEPIVRPLEDELFGFVKAPLWVLLGSMTVVLLIACANVTNLFLVRSERNLRDLAVRRAIGAGSAQLARLQLSESVVIAGMAGVLAVGLAWVTLPALVSSAPGQVPRLSEAVLTPSTLAFTLLLCLIVAFVCGLPPAMRAAGARTSALREGARGTTRRRHRGRDALVTLQTALALTLLVGSGLLLRSFQALQAVDPGYDVEDVFTFQMAIEDEPGLEDAVSLARFHLDFLDRLRALPGVASAGIVENVPLNEGVGVGPFQTEATMDDEGAAPTLGRTWAAGDYFEVMNIGLLRGRTFEDAEQLDNPGSVIVSERAAELLWPGEDPIGKRLYWSLFESWETVVGVVEDVMQYDFRDEVQPAHGLLPACRAGPGGLGVLVSGVRSQDRTRRRDRAGGPGSGARGSAVGPDVSGLHHGRTRGRHHDRGHLHDDGARCRLGDGAPPGGGGAVRRALLRGRRAHPRDRGADGAWRARRGRAPHGRSSGRPGRQRRSRRRARRGGRRVSGTGKSPLRRELGRPAHVRARRGDHALCRHRSQLPPRSSCVEPRSGGVAAVGLRVGRAVGAVLAPRSSRTSTA